MQRLDAPPQPRRPAPSEDARQHEQRRSRQRTRDTIAELRDARFSHGLRCPRCGSRRVHRWGSAHGRQRYRCLACSRTFSDLTGTPAAYLKKLELLTRYVACMRESLTLRESARRLGVHPSTTFRWRHRLLAALRDAPAPALGGWIELDCFWLAHSRKGERRRMRDRPPHHPAHPADRAHPARPAAADRSSFSDPRVCVLLAGDRLGGLLTGLAPRPYPDPDGIEHLLAGRTDPEGVVLVSTRGAPYGPEARLARRSGWGFERARSGGLTAPRLRPEHVRTVVGYRLRLRRWLRRFRGVATKYLANYLAWHRALDAAVRVGLEATLVRWPLASGFG